MSMTNVNAPFATAAIHEFDAVASRLPGEWLAPVRRAAIEALASEGFPSRRHERWKYTDLTTLLQQAFTPAPLASPPEAFLQGIHRFEMDCYTVTFINGVYQRNLSSEIEADGVRIRPLAELLNGEPEILRHAIGGNRADAFESLNTAYLHDGALIEVERDAALDKPLHLIFLSMPHAGGAIVSNPRLVFRGGENSEACLLESHIGTEGANNFCNLVFDAALAPGARLRHLRLIEAAQDEFHIATMNATVGRDANYCSHQICLSGKLVRNNLTVNLSAENAGAELNGFIFAGGTTHVDNHLEARHLAPRTNSVQSYRAVLDGRSRAVFNGKVYVAKDAQKIDAQQASNNLLLSKLAEIDTKPELEIYADDVKCSHGATVGQLDENMLFYLRSRGIDAETARGLLIYAFADDVIRRVGIPAVRAHVEEAVLGRLPDAERLREFF